MSSEFSPKVLELLGQSNKETIKIEPVNSGLVKNPTQEDPSYWNIAQDMFLSVPQGVVNAVEEQGDFIDENIVSLGGIEFGDKDGKLSFNDFIPRYVTPTKWKSEEYSKKRQLPIFHKPETLAGNMTEGVSRFITGFAGPAKFLKGAGLSGSLIKTSLRGFGAGAVADLTVFDPTEGRLSDMLVEFDSPLLNNAVTQYLATDESDSEMEGRLKNVLEGMALGGIFESVFYGIKGWKKMRGVRDLDERAKIQKETSDVIDEIQNPKIKKVSEDLNISKEEKILKNIDDFEITSKKDYFSIVSKTKQLTKEYSGTPVTKKEKYIIQTEYSKKLNAMTVSDVKVSKEFRNTGVGKALYKIAIKDAFDKGLDFASDYSISESALRVYKSLEKEGFDIIYNKNVKTIKNEVRLDPERGKQIITTDKTDTMPVVIIKRKLKDIKIKSIKVRKFALEGDQGVNPKEALKIITKSKETAKQDSELWIKKVINTKSFKNGEQVLRTIDNIVDNGFDDVTKNYLENDVLSNEVALELAMTAGRNQKEVLKSITKEGVRAKEGVVRMLTTKSVLQKLALDLQENSVKYLDEFGEDSAKWSKKAREDLDLRKQVIKKTFVSLKDQIRGGARTTQAGRIKVPAVDGKEFDMDKIANIFKNFDANPAVMAKKIRDMQPDDIINEVTKSRFSKAIEVFNSLYINSILSGTPTFIVNTVGNAYETFLKPLELAAGAALRGDIKTIRSGFSQYVGMVHTMRDTIRAVGTALRQGDAVLDPKVRTQDNLEIVNGKAIRPISGSNLGFDGKVGTAIDWIGRISEFPTRLLMGTDELFKQIIYRGKLYSEAVDNTLELKFKLGSKEAKENIDKIFKNGFDENGMANVKDNDIAARALESARVGTFQNSLNDGRLLNIGKAVESFLKEAPYLKFLAPFVRTPTNLWRNVESRIPVLGAFTKPMRELWKSGDRRARADVLGRQLFGFSASIYAYHLVNQDVTDNEGNVYPRVTGAGPKDTNIKKLWFQNGWQPYSIAQQNPDGTITYKQYNRNDPRFSILAIAADIRENQDNIDDEQKQNMFTVGVLSAIKSAGNKSYLRGISDAFDLAENLTPETFAKYAGRQIGNAIPYQALLGQGVPGITEPDKEILQARGFVDEIIKKTPFIDKTKYLEPRLDVLTGEPIEKTGTSVYFNPDGFLSVTQGAILVGRKSELKEDPVRLEIARLKIRAIAEPNQKELKVVNLIDYKKNNVSAHNYWISRIGKTTVGGLTLKERLDQTISSVSYLRRQEGNENFEGGKEMIIKKIFQAYKEKAKQDMLEEYPDVAEAVKNARIEKYGLRKSTFDIDEGPKELLPRR
jgi:GNAT superfamily N-acetyltransferase